MPCLAVDSSDAEVAGHMARGGRWSFSFSLVLEQFIIYILQAKMSNLLVVTSRDGSMSVMHFPEFPSSASSLLNPNLEE